MLKKIIIRGLLILIAIPLTIFILLIAFNWRDEELLPEVKVALNWQIPEHAFEDNAFLIIAGMSAPENDDAVQLGKKQIELDIARFVHYQKTQQENDPQDDANKQAKDILNISELNKLRCNYREEKSCLAFYLKQEPQKLTELITSNQILLSRLAAAKASRHYVEVMPPMMKSSVPSYSYALAAIELERMMAIREIQDGKEEQGIARLVENNQFAQRMLVGSSSLISHMITIASIQRDVRIMGELLQKYPQLAKQSAQIAPMLISLNTKSMTLGKVFKFENTIVLQSLFALDKNGDNQEISKVETLLYGLFARPNAGVNLAYVWNGFVVDVAEQSEHQFDVAYNDMQKKQKELLGWGIPPLQLYFKDPVAKVLLQVTEPGYQNYFLRHFDMQGQINLLALQLKIVGEHLDDVQIVTLLQKNEAQYQNPYTLQAMQWNAKERTISFEGRAQGSHLFGGGNNYVLKIH
jgi:hypothetical protein